jgi:hypothetical protein
VACRRIAELGGKAVKGGKGVWRCLKEDPVRRPGSAEALSRQLEAFSFESAWTVERAER